jgi:hypothetical protein
VTVALACRQAPHRAAARRQRPGRRGSGAARAAASSGLPVILITIGALVLANIVAALPGRVAASTPTALLLRAE